jgi:hypothetical protein
MKLGPIRIEHTAKQRAASRDHVLQAPAER